MCAAMFLWGGPFVGIFVDDAEVIAIGGRAIRITSLFYIPLGMIYVARSLLNGAGDSFFAFANGLAEVVGRIGVFTWTCGDSGARILGSLVYDRSDLADHRSSVHAAGMRRGSGRRSCW